MEVNGVCFDDREATVASLLRPSVAPRPTQETAVCEVRWVAHADAATNLIHKVGRIHPAAPSKTTAAT